MRTSEIKKSKSRQRWTVGDPQIQHMGISNQMIE
jgi:hypothetical protein